MPPGSIFIEADFEEIIVPAIWESDTFLEKVGPENRNMMWRFSDKGNRDVCLVPEITGMLQEMWRTDWSKKMATRNVFYVAKCYRYERPQKGRYREFTQIGVEMLGQKNQKTAFWLLTSLIEKFNTDFEYDASVQRGLSYYTDAGFEVRAPWLGAQKQIAGGGVYSEGTGWAIGLDRLVLALSEAP